MGRKQTERVGGDLRDYPRYSTSEAAEYLGIPESTVKAWVRGYKRRNRYGEVRTFAGVIKMADPKRGLLSFFNLAEAHVLRATRQRDVPLKQVRHAIEYIREHDPERPHPLLRRDLATHAGSVFVKELGQPVNASRHGQIGMKALLMSHLKRITWAPDGLPAEIAPMYSTKIALNPSYSSGQPTVVGTGIMVSVLSARRDAGETVIELARDYGIRPQTIEKAIRDFAQAA